VTQTQAFLLTLVVELPLVALGAWLSGAPRGRLGPLLVVALAANALTHPLLWIVDAALAATLATPHRWTLLETAVVVVEGSAYAAIARLGWARGLLLALLANAASFGAGLWIYAHG
jgi:hypothetical protein